MWGEGWELQAGGAGGCGVGCGAGGGDVGREGDVGLDVGMWGRM